MGQKGRITAVCVAVSLAAAPAAFGSQTGPGRPAQGASITVRGGVTQPVFSYKDAIRETVYVESTIDQDRDGDLDLLATDIIRPKETDGSVKVPVIYEMSPYYQTLGRGNESETKLQEDGDFVPEMFPLFYDNYFVPRGYAVVLQDMRGTRNSEGCMVLGGRGELIDAKATIDWLNGRGKAFTADGKPVKADWSTGKVGMIGKSYDGTIANGAASTGIEGLETIVPIAAISRWYDYHLNNGAQYLNAYLTPGLFTFVIDQPPADDEERGAEWVEATFGENGPCSAVGAEVVAQGANPVADYNEFWDERDYLKDVEKVRASVFLVHGRNDYNVKPNHYVQWWEALASHDVERKIWLAEVGHVDPFDFRRDEWIDTLHRWFDHELHDIDNGIMQAPMADVEQGPGNWKRYPTWPAAGARETTLFFGPASRDVPGTLSTERSKAAAQTFTDDPFQSESQMVAEPESAKDNRLIFSTPTLERDVRISGSIEVKINASVDRPDTNFTALLVDYGQGDEIELVDADVRTTDKEKCYGASTKQDDACYFVTEEVEEKAPVEVVSRGWLDARHHESLRHNSPLVPGSSYNFKWPIFGDDYVFERGHKIGLVIAANDRNFIVTDPSAATITVDLAKSELTLPVVGGAGRLGF